MTAILETIFTLSFITIPLGIGFLHHTWTQNT